MNDHQLQLRELENIDIVLARRVIESLTIRIGELKDGIRWSVNEMDCRIEHGVDDVVAKHLSFFKSRLTTLLHDDE